MKQARRGPIYDVGVVVLVASLLVLSATALVVIFRGEGAFPVRVFGSAEEGMRDEVQPAAMRPPEAAPVRRGGLGEVTRLRWLSGGEPPPPSAVGVGTPGLLDRARDWAGREEWERAIPAYERLVRERPGDTQVRVERARALAWAGQTLEGAQALARVAAERPADRALRVEAARFYWWAGRTAEADSLLAEAAARGALDAEELALRREIRGAMTPDAATAERWLREEDGTQARLRLARALVGEREFERAIAAYRAALATGGVPDSVRLELASAALAADSAAVAVDALRAFLVSRPDHRDARVNLARALGWSQRWEEAVAEFEVLLAGGDDAALRYELGQLHRWAGRHETAERELRRAAVADPLHAPTFRALGDLARWRGEWEMALASYHHAALLDPQLPGVSTAIEETRHGYRQARLAAAPFEIDRCTVGVESYADNQGFRRLTTSAGRSWTPTWGVLNVVVQQDLSGGYALERQRAEIGGYGVLAEGITRPRRGVSFNALLGLHAFGGGGTTPTWGAGVDFAELARAAVSLRYVHQPAFRRASSLAALEAGVTSDAVRATVSRPIGAASAWAQLEAERLGSPLGSSERLTGSLSLSRPLSERWSLGLSAHGLTTTAGAPVLPGWGTLYWSPELYLATSLNVTYRAPLDDRWSLAATLRPGYAWVRERAGEERRFEAARTPTLGLGADVGFQSGRWNVGAGLDWGGAVGTRGYRATTIQLRGTYLLELP
jgi:tetratricopeptide (TPR) repeat protein